MNEQVGTVDVRFAAGESYEFGGRGHRLLADQPPEADGADEASTPTELFVASLATCVAFYTGRYLTGHGLNRDGLGVSVHVPSGGGPAGTDGRDPVDVL